MCSCSFSIYKWLFDIKKDYYTPHIRFYNFEIKSKIINLLLKSTLNLLIGYKIYTELF